MMFRAVRRRKSLRLGTQSLVAFALGFLMSYDAARDYDSMAIGTAKRSIGADDGERAPRQTAPSTTLESLGIIATKQRQLYGSVLPPEYGEFDRIFHPSSLERVFGLSPLSRKRLTRKLMIKMLQARVGGGRNGRGDRGGGDGTGPVLRWATTGDSAAAGHGNGYAHSYTSVLQDTVSDVFHSVGVEFVASNHAGDAYSGMELALCLDSIAGGGDVDFLSSDFAHRSSTPDHGDPLSPSQGIDPLLFGERAGRVFKRLPFLFFLGITSGDGAQSLERLETSGMGVSFMGVDALRELVLTLPDYKTNRGKNVAAAIDKFQCNGVMEGKEMCDDEAQLFWCNSKAGEECVNAKYLAECRYERHQTPYNDGWKMHRLKGRLLGFYLVEMLRLAAVELDALEQQQPKLRADPGAALDLLRNEEEVEEFLFAKTRPSRHASDEGEALESWDNLKRKRAACLTSKESAKAGSFSFEADPPHEALCEDTTPFQNVYIRLNRDDGFVSVHPTKESGAYGAPFAVGLCLKKCYGHQCSQDTEPLDLKNVELRINGSLVNGSELSEVGGCYITRVGDDLASIDSTEIRNTGMDALLLSSVFILH